MGGKTSGAMDWRMRFVLAHESGLYSMTELCALYGISRQSGYKWVERYRTGGIEALRDRSRAPKRSPQRISPEMRERLLQERKAHRYWGPRKILARLRVTDPEIAEELPAASTVGELYRREDLVEPRKRRRHPNHPTAGALDATRPNAVWTADFKGEFRLGSGAYCYPFTLVDAFSRFILACQGERSTALQGAQAALTEAFRRYGLPQAIRTDNGTPFVGHGLSGLSQLNVWWMKLGIEHQRIAPGRPDQNGRHERMHRTLGETTRPPAEDFASQQARFDGFRHEFNHERPHEALDNETPASRYEPSPRPFPERIRPPEYPGYFEVRKVDATGHFKFRGHTYFIAHPMAHESLGLFEIDDDVWSVCFYQHELGRISPTRGIFVIKVSTMSPV